jgi:hypothetical protein
MIDNYIHIIGRESMQFDELSTKRLMIKTIDFKLPHTGGMVKPGWFKQHQVFIFPANHLMSSEIIALQKWTGGDRSLEVSQEIRPLFEHKYLQHDDNVCSTRNIVTLNV